MNRRGFFGAICAAVAAIAMPKTPVLRRLKMDVGRLQPLVSVSGVKRWVGPALPVRAKYETRIIDGHFEAVGIDHDGTIRPLSEVHPNPFDWANGRNWSDGSPPANNDLVIIERDTPSPAAWGLNSVGA